MEPEPKENRRDFSHWERLQELELKQLVLFTLVNSGITDETQFKDTYHTIIKMDL